MKIHGNLAHDIHSGKCDCGLSQNKHFANCTLYNQFMETLRNFKTDAIQDHADSVSQASDNFVRANLNYDPDLLDLEDQYEEFMTAATNVKQENTLCCCNKNLPHDESMKFILKADPNKLNTVLFKDRGQGELIQMNQRSKAYKMPLLHDKTFMIGRYLDIHNIVQLLTNPNASRIIKVYGKVGQFNEQLTMNAVKYCVERNMFNDGAFNIDNEGNSSTQTFLNLVFQTLRLEKTNLDELTDYIHQSNMVFVMYDLLPLFEKVDKERNQFLSILENLICRTVHLKIVLIFEMNIEIKIQSMPNIDSVEIKPLQKKEAIRFFKAIDKDGILPEDHVLTRESFFEQRSNQELMDIYQNWRI